jgi:PIN domain nuclease of toxin-antitoxin system
VSAASIWEIAIKSRLGKIDTDPEEMAAAIEESGFVELPVTSRHAAQVARLPCEGVQSMAEPLILLTGDAKLQSYGGLARYV